jgi:hypothetical protein
VLWCAAGELDDLLGRLQQLADTAGGAPLMTVSDASCGSNDAGAVGGGAFTAGGDAGAGAPGGGGNADEWELL